MTEKRKKNDEKSDKSEWASVRDHDHRQIASR
jgi:hypothetical protein